MACVGSRFARALLVGLMGLAAWSPLPAGAQVLAEDPQPVPAETASEDLGPDVPESELPEPAAEEFQPAVPDPEPIAPETPSFEGIEEITVTSQGREQTVQDAAISVAAFNSEYLEALGVQDIADVSQFTPNLEIRAPTGTPTLFIRGVGLRDFNANSSSSVAVYNDDVYMNSPVGQLGQLFDLQAVEVLRGPQGTLYGRNATAGVIRVITQKPTDEVSGFASATYGRFDQIDVEGGVNWPILPDLLSMRVSGIMHLRDGTTDNRCADDKFWRDAQGETTLERKSLEWRVFYACFNNDVRRDPPLGLGWDAGAPPPPPPGLTLEQIGNAESAVVPPGIAKKVNDVDNWAGRGQLRLRPTGGSDWIFNVHGGHDRALARQFQMFGSKENTATGEYDLGQDDIDGYKDPDTVRFETIFPFRRCDLPNPCASTKPEDGDPFQGDYNLTEPEVVNLLGSSLSGEIPIGWGALSLRSITAYEWNERQIFSNADASPYIGLEVEFGNEAWQVSQDLKAFWDAGGAWTWQAGLTFLHEDLDVLNNFTFAPGQVNAQDYRQETYYGSPYGFFSWAPSDELSIEGGLRWNIEHKSYEIEAFLVGQDDPPTTRREEITEQAPSGDISLNYRAFEDVNVFAKYSRGWKGPHFNGNVITTSGETGENLIEPVEPENVNALELGLKSMWFDNRLRFDVVGFYYDYENIQIFQVRNTAGGIPVQELINANDADVYGVEIEAEARPLEGWVPAYLEGLRLFGSFAWLESRYTDFLHTRVDSVGSAKIARTENFSGNRLINAPKFAFAGYAQWDFAVGRYGTLTPRFDWSFKDEVFFSPANIEPVGQEALWLMNARLAYRTPDDTIEVAGWVRNLTDQVYRLDVIDLTRFQNSILYAMGDPRTYGISFSVSF